MLLKELITFFFYNLLFVTKKLIKNKIIKKITKIKLFFSNSNT